LLIRALAHHDLLEDLRTTVIEYIGQENPTSNIELAFYAAKAGMPVSEVTAIAGHIEAPKINCPDYLSRSDPVFWDYAYSFIVLGYENNESSLVNLCTVVGTRQSLWNSTLRYLLKICHCIGRSLRSEAHDWFEEACESIDMLVNAKQGDGERICDSIDLIRDILPFTIGLMTEEIQKHFPERLDVWIESLALLRDSILWNTHFGISESRQDYDFELRLWETLAINSKVSSRLTNILSSCAATYEQTTMLKGGCRSDHFMWLTAIMAKCGMREEAGKWLHYGIRSSLIYGYHKDTTLLLLIDVLRLVNQREPDMALERCARILWMVDWMHHLTDDRETKWFTGKVFSAVLAVNRQAAFDLLKHFSQSTARWVMQDCLEEYILSAEKSDPEYLWCLSESFTNHYSEDGRHPKQIIGTRQHIVDLVRESCSKDILSDFEDRFRNFVLTEITPRHWPDHLREELSMPLASDAESKIDTATSEHLSSTFMLNGEKITIESIAEKCRESFSEFLATLEKLKSQNEYYNERDMVDTTLQYHITKACSLSELITIKDYIESQGRWQNQSAIESLAERFIEFGDQDNSIACLGLAYASYGGWSRWKNNSKYFAAIAEKDRAVANISLLKECYESCSASTGGYDTPPVAAAGLNILNESHMLEAVFNDFLTHCESMFSQLPEGSDYAWLKNYAGSSFDENQLILQFSIEELNTPEIDHSKRLIRALVRLAVARPENTIPVIVSKTLSASGRILRRLLMILLTLATHNPDLLVKHQKALIKLLDLENFFCRQSVLHILRYVSESLPLETSVVTSVQRIERQYSAIISHSTYRMSSSPSATFLSFLKRHTLFDFFDQVSLTERVLKVRPGSLVSAIEECLYAQNWSMDEERSRIKGDWYGHVHPQGWPVVWITTEFQEQATEVLWNILNEAVEKLKLSHDQAHWLWQTSQIVDPEYLIKGVTTRPSDIEPLCVNDKNAWFKELDAIESFQVGNTGAKKQDSDWITVFEKRILAHDEKFNVPYRQEISLKATLIPMQVYGGLYELDVLDLVTEEIMPASMMAVTLEQARNVLTSRRNTSHASDDCIPLVAEHQNPTSFLGYWDVCTLASSIIDKFNLSFKEFDLTRGEEVIAKFETWQEGYQDESYTREKLSFGVRLQVRRDFLSEVCHLSHKILCIQIKEKREFYNSIYKSKPDDRRYGKRYIIYHL